MVNQIKRPFTFTVSLTQKSHELAEKFCSYHSNLHKSEQVYLNTLAIYAVKHYLQCLGFATDWEASNSYDIIMQSFFNIADLEVKNHGKLECRLVLPNAEFVYIPQEVWTGRIAYIIVQIDEDLQTANLLGFTQRVDTEKLPLKQLCTLEEFPEYLQKITPPINLNEWFEDILKSGWQTLESLLNTESLGNLNLSFQSSDRLQKEEIIQGVKRIEFENKSVFMLVALKPEENKHTSICVRIYPGYEENCLTENMKLAILSDSGEILREVTSRSIDNFIQLPIFQCTYQENFTIMLSLNDSCFTESFFI